MTNYKNQNGCHNCKFCFIRTDYAENIEFFCIHNAEVRPPCGSIKMGEQFDRGYVDHMNDEYITVEQFNKAETIRRKVFENNYKIWNEWAEKYSVSSFGICDKWEK